MTGYNYSLNSGTVRQSSDRPGGFVKHFYVCEAKQALFACFASQTATTEP